MDFYSNKNEVSPMTSRTQMARSPSVFVAHAKALEKGNAKYPIKRTICKDIYNLSWKFGCKSGKFILGPAANSHRDWMRAK